MTDPIKQLTPTPALTALVKDVFGPSAKLLGTELKSYLKQKFDDARERRRNENLNNHISAVRASLPKPPPENVTYERLDLFSDWVEGAQDVSEDDPLLSEMWRQMLRDIVGGHHITKSLIEIMKQIDSRMAALLLSFRRERPGPIDLPFLLSLSSGRRFYDEDLFHAKRLEALGLLERDYTRIAFVILVVGISVIGGYLAYDYIVTPKLVGSTSVVWQSLKYTLPLYGAVFGYLLIGRTITRPAFRLTWTADKLLKYAKPPKPESEETQPDATKGT